MTKAITAFFDTLAQAEQAAQDLATEVGGVRGEVYDTKRSGELSRLSIPGEDAATYNEGIRRGGAVLHAQVPDHRFDAAADAPEAAGPLTSTSGQPRGGRKAGRVAAPRRAA